MTVLVHGFCKRCGGSGRLDNMGWCEECAEVAAMDAADSVNWTLWDYLNR